MRNTCIILLVAVVLATVAVDVTWGQICTTTTYITTYSRRSSSYKCGFWSWRRCTRYHTTSSSTPVEVQECCEGAYGYVETGCIGECPYESPQISQACAGATCRDFTCDTSAFHSVFPVFELHENAQHPIKVFTADATCFVQYTCPDCSCDCDRTRRSVYSDVSERERRSTSCLCSKNEPCSKCTVSNQQLFEVINGVDIWTRFCSNRVNGQGCISANIEYDPIAVTCTGSGNDDNGGVTTSFVLDVEAEDAPVFIIGDTAPEPVADGSMGAGDVILQLSVDFDDTVRHEDTQCWAFGAESPSTARTLFYFDCDAMSLTVQVDLSTEPSYVYSLNVCVKTNYHLVCTPIDVTFVTSMTTTSTTPATTTTETPTFCQAIGAWSISPAMDSWCQLVCTHSTPFCPETHCYCNDRPIPGRSVCTPTSDYAGINGMYNWCDWNCNTDYPISCLPSVCTCDPYVDYNVTAPWQITATEPTTTTFIEN